MVKKIVSSIDNDEDCVMHSKRDSTEIMMTDEQGNYPKFIRTENIQPSVTIGEDLKATGHQIRPQRPVTSVRRSKQPLLETRFRLSFWQQWANIHLKLHFFDTINFIFLTFFLFRSCSWCCCCFEEKIFFISSFYFVALLFFSIILFIFLFFLLLFLS